MKTKMTITLALLAVAGWTVAVQAQDDNGQPGGPPPDGSFNGGPPDGGPPNGGFHRPPPLPLFRALDVNHDGIIESNEIANASAELLTLDKNGDGQLTPDEYLPPRPTDTNGLSGTFRPPPSPLVNALDVNHDGIIDSNEIANASAELLTLDKNGDGQLTPDEYRPHRPHPHDNSGNDNSSNDQPPGPPPGDDDMNGGPPGPPPNQ